MHFYCTASPLVAGTPFVSFGMDKPTFVGLQNLPLLEQGNKTLSS